MRHCLQWIRFKWPVYHVCAGLPLCPCRLSHRASVSPPAPSMPPHRALIPWFPLRSKGALLVPRGVLLGCWDLIKGSPGANAQRVIAGCKPFQEPHPKHFQSLSSHSLPLRRCAEPRFLLHRGRQTPVRGQTQPSAWCSGASELVKRYCIF